VSGFDNEVQNTELRVGHGKAWLLYIHINSSVVGIEGSRPEKGGCENVGPARR